MLTLPLLYVLALSALMLIVIWLDATRYIIPNWLCATVLGLWPLALVLMPMLRHDWEWALLATAMMFVAGFGIFALRWMGGGDVKLLIATMPWVGWGEQSLLYIIGVALAGGALALVLLLTRRALSVIPQTAHAASLPKILQQDAPIPYGLAIAGIFMWMLWDGRLALGVGALL